LEFLHRRFQFLELALQVGLLEYFQLLSRQEAHRVGDPRVQFSPADLVDRLAHEDGEVADSGQG
jgi:hypothetical protein